MELLDKLMAAFKPKQEAPAEQAEAQPAPEAEQAAPAEAPKEAEQASPEAPKEAEQASPEADPAALAEMVSKLEGFVYDPELASELAPAFVAMSAVEGFDKVMELFAAKEKQIEALNVGGQEQKSTPEVQEKEPEAEQPKSKSATEILRERAAAAQNKQTQSK